MHARTHLLIAMFFGYWYFRLVPDFAVWEKYVFSIFIIGASLLPDIDLPTSSLGRKHHFISYFATHRGAFHSVWIPLFSLAFSKVVPAFRAPLTAIFVGYGAHLLADSVTKIGIKPFAPLSKWTIKGPFKVGSLLETAISALVVMFFLVQPF
jgi:membrane-bound metal-dependent hydrolase YbcI (DUF457 family)